MIELFFKGGPIFMGILTVILLMVVFTSVIIIISISTKKINNSELTLKKINHIKSAGLSALIIGLLGQLIGLFSAFRAIKFKDVEASASLFAEGFRISMITAVYGILIFSFSMLIWYILKKAMKDLDVKV